MDLVIYRSRLIKHSKQQLVKHVNEGVVFNLLF
jgi:hypothetical protein